MCYLPLLQLLHYTFRTCQQAKLESRDVKLEYETSFILSNDGCIFPRFHALEYNANTLNLFIKLVKHMIISDFSE